jgi:hypothetical protein
MVACTSSTSRTADGTTNPTETSTLVTAADAHVLVDSRYASTRLGDRWLVLEAVIGARTGQRIDVARDAITVRTPSGLTLPLATQQDYAEAYGELRSAVLHPAVAEPSPRVFGAPRRSCGRWFFTPPAEGFAADSLSIGGAEQCWGVLAFQVPGGVQPGPWRLDIDLEESDVRVPFRVEDREGRRR